MHIMDIISLGIFLFCLTISVITNNWLAFFGFLSAIVALLRVLAGVFND